MKAVIYQPDSGDILQRCEGSLGTIERTAAGMGAAFLPVAADRPWERTHRVIDGALVEKEA